MTAPQHPAEFSVSSIDWQWPWLSPYRSAGERVWNRWLGGSCLADALNAELGDAATTPALGSGSLQFVQQDALPEGESYEAFIFAHAQVPTRDNLHDFFNGLVWLRFPAIKRHLNLLHAAQDSPIKGEGKGTRGPVRDALTIFDENAAVLYAPAFLYEALRRREWRTVFVTDRSVWAECAVTVVGHALLEKLCRPRKDVTAHVWCLPPGQEAPEYLIAQMQPEILRCRPWCPLPVLGIPGWWAANQSPDFYDDSAVFRPLGPSRGSVSNHTQIRLKKGPGGST